MAGTQFFGPSSLSPRVWICTKIEAGGAAGDWTRNSNVGCRCLQWCSIKCFPVQFPTSPSEHSWGREVGKGSTVPFCRKQDWGCSLGLQYPQSLLWGHHDDTMVPRAWVLPFVPDIFQNTCTAWWQTHCQQAGALCAMTVKAVVAALCWHSWLPSRIMADGPVLSSWAFPGHTSLPALVLSKWMFVIFMFFSCLNVRHPT